MRIILVLSAAAGIGIGTAFPLFWLLVPLGLALFLRELLLHTHSLKGALVCGALAGFFSGGGGVIWMWDMYPLLDAGTMSSASQWILIALVWSITALLAALSFAGAGALMYLIRANAFASVGTGLILVAEEQVRMWLYALYSYSSESLLGPHFSQTALGYALAGSDYLRQIAYPLGLPALTFALGVFAYAAVMLLQAAGARKLTLQGNVAVAAAALLLLVPLAHSEKEAAARPYEVAVISTEEGMDQAVLKELFEDSVAANPGLDLIAFPEGVSPEFLTDTQYLQSVFEDRNPLIMSSLHAEARSSFTAQIAYDTPREGRIGSYTKLFLMPQGEYLPAIARLLYPLSGDPNPMQHAQSVGKRLVRGTELVAQEHDGVAVGGMLCSDILSPSLYRALQQQHAADVLVNLSNPSWFHGSRTYQAKVEQLASVRAAESRRYFLLASNAASSLILDPRGKVIGASRWNTAGALIETLALPN